MSLANQVIKYRALPSQGTSQEITADKIASAAAQLRAGPRFALTWPEACQAGDLVAVKVVRPCSAYPYIELANGRMAQLHEGDVVVGSLGLRKALRGFEGT